MANTVAKISSHVAEKPQRRRLTAEFKKGIIEKAAVLEKSGGSVGEMLRQNGLYYSQLADWRRALPTTASTG
jgi:transposase-like protein